MESKWYATSHSSYTGGHFGSVVEPVETTVVGNHYDDK